MNENNIIYTAVRFYPPQKRVLQFPRTDGQHHPADPDTRYTAVVLRGVADLLIAHTHIIVIRSIGDRRMTTQLGKMSFDEIFDLAAGVCFLFLVIYMQLRRKVLVDKSEPALDMTGYF